MSTPESKTVKARKPREKRRNLATERSAVAQYCKLSIQVVDSWNDNPAAFNEETKAYIRGKRSAYVEILKQMGEGSE